MSKFVVVDVETANSSRSSICQIGVAVFEEGRLIETWETLINPYSYFDWFNKKLHGIDEDMVANSPSILDVESILRKYFEGNIIATYGSLDRTAIVGKLTKLREPKYKWLDITQVVRRTWNDYSYKGYSLSNICKVKGIPLNNHHNALNDAISAGYVLNKALSESEIPLAEWFDLTQKPIAKLLEKGILPDSTDLNKKGFIEGGNPLGKYFGSIVVFTGELSIPRVEATILASQLGFDVNKGVTKKTNYLVKGTQDVHKLKGAEISDKERKALEHIKKGNDIIFLSEIDFFELIRD